MLVHPTHLVLSSATLSNKIYCCSFLVKNLVVCVPSTTADCNLFNNHRNRKVVKGKHNVLVLYVNDSAPNPFGVVLCNTFIWDILLFIILLENHVACVPSTTAKWISFRNNRNRKVVGGKHNVLVLYVNVYAPDSAGAVFCNPFKWDILWFISGQKSCYFCACNSAVKRILFLKPH